MTDSRPQRQPDLPDGPGTYLLVLRMEGSGTLQVGKLGTMSLRQGYYLYVGSARGPGGLRARLNRHLREEKTVHWHIDYLRQRTEVLDIWYCPGKQNLEHRTAAAVSSLEAAAPVRPGFGSSDCRCPSHLFFTLQAPDFRKFRKVFREPAGPGSGWRKCSPEEP